MRVRNPESLPGSFFVSADGYATNELHGMATSHTFWRAQLGKICYRDRDEEMTETWTNEHGALDIMRVSRPSTIVAALPSFVFLCLYFSLVVHMHRTLGGWPSGIGVGGFPAALAAHANATEVSFAVVGFISILLAPAALLVCLFVPRWRHLAFYFAFCSVLFAISWALMGLAPEPFLGWWRD